MLVNVGEVKVALRARLHGLPDAVHKAEKQRKKKWFEGDR
jgi:hypothetical protein